MLRTMATVASARPRCRIGSRSMRAQAVGDARSRRRRGVAVQRVLRRRLGQPASSAPGSPCSTRRRSPTSACATRSPSPSRCVAFGLRGALAAHAARWGHVAARRPAQPRRLPRRQPLRAALGPLGRRHRADPGAAAAADRARHVALAARAADARCRCSASASASPASPGRRAPRRRRGAVGASCSARGLGARLRHRGHALPAPVLRRRRPARRGLHPLRCPARSSCCRSASSSKASRSTGTRRSPPRCVYHVVLASIGAYTILHLLLRRGQATGGHSLLYLTPPVAALVEWVGLRHAADGGDVARHGGRLRRRGDGHLDEPRVAPPVARGAVLTDRAGLSRSGRAAGTPSAPSARACGSRPRPRPPTAGRRSPRPRPPRRGAPAGSA